MKARISVTIEKEANRFLKSLLKEGKYRNKSHIIEEAIKLLREKEDDKD